MFAKALIFVGLFASPALATQVTGTQRIDIIKQGASACLDNNVKKPENRPYTLAVVDAFCTCVGTGAADGFTIEELVQAGEKMTAEFAARRDTMTRKCTAETFGRAKP